MLYVSLGLNAAVLVPVLAWIARDSASATGAYGPDTQARRILAAMYGTILLMSVALIALLATGFEDAAAWTTALLTVQVLYKMATVPIVGLSNPVVASNAAIAAVHAATIASQLA